MSGMSNRSLLVPGKPTPIRTVPDHIERPEYVWKDEVRENIGETFIQPPEVIEAMREDYIRTARAKGASEARVLWRHGVRNALIPVVTILALDFGTLFSGALITETMFAQPGMGKLIYDAIMNNDYNLALVGLLFATLVTLLANLAADIGYAKLDPRISYR